MNPKYPIYIPSKGRYESRLTVKALERINVPYKIVIEEQEYYNYKKYIDKKHIIVLPFSNLGLGSIPARNFIWEHSLSYNFKRHWILDDNLSWFYRVNKNTIHPVASGTIFRIIEDFTERYTNIALSGMNYEMFVPRRNFFPPYYLNTRIYSCILIDNSLPFRWRGKYNEDTDLSLNCLKAGYCTVLFNAFVCKKMATMRMKGGNTDELYKDNGRYLMAKSLCEFHPDVSKITWKWGRWQHVVNYKPFSKNKLIRKDNTIYSGVNNYKMVLIDNSQSSQF